MARGPVLPNMTLQKIAGLFWAAHLQYWRGADQKDMGAIVKGAAAAAARSNYGRGYR